jgi:hypothetical protein
VTFAKGESGNPAGRPRGSRNKRTLLAEHLLESDAEAIVRTMIERAKEGDMAAVRLCVDRICPRVTDRPAGFELPPLARAADAPSAMAAIAQALADGDLSSAEAADLGRFVESFARAFSEADQELRLARLEAIEKRNSKGPPAPARPFDCAGQSAPPPYVAVFERPAPAPALGEQASGPDAPVRQSP